MDNLKEQRRIRRVKKKQSKKKLKFLVFGLIIVGCIGVGKIALGQIRDMEVPNKIYSFLSEKNNRIKAFNNAVALNNNSSANTCVYFISEVLRQNDINIDRSTANTSQLLDILNAKGWKKDRDYKKLKPGDIVFTTDEYGNEKGIPSHTYVFMKWVEEGNYEFAYICDNQAKDYENMIYHKRNIKNIDTANGTSKDAFSFFMKP